MLNKINDVDLCKEGSIYNNALNVQMHIFNQHYDITIELINKYLFHWLFIVLCNLPGTCKYSVHYCKSGHRP